MTAYQLSDDQRDSGEEARFVTYEAQERFYLGQFVFITCPTTRASYFGVVSSHSLNIPRGVLGATDSTTFNQIELIAADKLQRDVVVRELWMCRVQFIADVTDGVRSVTRRPLTTANARPATNDEITATLNLPIGDWSLGVIRNHDLPLYISSTILRHHMLVAGTTGSGKSNVIANKIMADLALSCCVIVFDHKPDYQHIHLPNDEPDVADAAGLQDVLYYGIGRATGFNNGEAPVSVPFAHLEPEVLAATIFNRYNENLQQEAFEALMAQYLEDDANPTKLGFIRWANNRGNLPAEVIAPASIGPFLRKIDPRKSRWPTWIDAGLNLHPGRMFGGRVATPQFDLATTIRAGRVIVIRVGSDMSEARMYALLLSFVMKRITALKEDGTITCPISIIVDEAQDIFDAGRQFLAIAERLFDTNIRKGRSLGIGFTLGVQAASKVPDSILGNLLSRVILQHDSVEQIKVAANMASEAQRQMTSSFGSGEALVRFYRARSIVHAEMRRSPFLLTKLAQ